MGLRGLEISEQAIDGDVYDVVTLQFFKGSSGTICIVPTITIPERLTEILNDYMYRPTYNMCNDVRIRNDRTCAR